jgi:PAS domain S-box-containing protein
LRLTFTCFAGTLGRMSALDDIGGDVEAALEDINVPSYVIDPYGVIRWINTAARDIVGDVRGKQFSSIVSPEDRRRAREVFAQKISGTALVTDAEVALVGKNGERVVVDVSSVPLLRGGQVIGVFGQAFYEEEHAARNAHPALTPRQTEVLHMLEQGMSTKQIADELHLSRETVRNHVRHLLHALGAKSRLEAVAVARRDYSVSG